jgi:ABC-type Fe3+-hydroxamate transport system substrate-binding protein
MRITKDALGRQVKVPATPRRIVSLCPSQTETLLELGASVIGRTRYCIHPSAQVSGITEVGGTKQVQWPTLEALQPDLIIAEKEENRREDVEQMAGRWPVYVTDVRDIDGALGMIQSLGELAGHAAQARAMQAAILGKWSRLQPTNAPLRVAYLIWRKPWMAAGPDTYINTVLRRCGLRNVFADATARYP